MIKDPATSWDGGPFPYDALAEVGVTPGMSHTGIQDVSFDLLARRLMTPVTQQAWDELRVVRRRMLAELLLYDVDPAAEVPAALAALDRALAGPPGFPARPETSTPTGPPGPPGPPDVPPLVPEETARLLDDLITFDI